MMFLTRRNVVILTGKIISKAILRRHHVAVIGSATDLGQIVSMMLRTEPSITKLTVHDNLPHNRGVVLDLSHIPSVSTLEGYTGSETLMKALKGANLVLAVGGMTNMPGITRDTMFNRNANFTKQLAKEICKLRPMPFVGIATEPINSMVPMAAEILRHSGGLDQRRLFGITGIDSLRATAMYAAVHGINPYQCFVPVIGGHSPKTIIPLLSQAQPFQVMEERDVRDYTHKLRNADDIVTLEKKGWGPSLSVACSVLQFTRGIIHALDGRMAKLNAFVENNDFGTAFVQGLVYINHEGITEMATHTNLTAYESELLEEGIKHLTQEVAEGMKVLEQD